MCFISEPRPVLSRVLPWRTWQLRSTENLTRNETWRSEKCFRGVDTDVFHVEERCARVSAVCRRDCEFYGDDSCGRVACIYVSCDGPRDLVLLGRFEMAEREYRRRWGLGIAGHSDRLGQRQQR